MKNKIAIIFLGNVSFDARCFNMIKTLSDASFHVDVYHVSSGLNQKKFLNKKIKLFNFSLNNNNWKKFYEWFGIIKKHSFKQYGAVIASDLYSLVGLYKHFSQTTIIYDSRDLFVELSTLQKRKMKKTFWSFAETYCLKYVHTVITSAKSDTLFLKKKYFKHNHLNYKTIYNFPWIQETKNNNYLRTTFNIKKNKKIILYQGVVQEGRGIDIMIACVQNNPVLVGVVLGEGHKKSYYEKKIVSCGLSNRFFFHKMVPYHNLLHITASADLGCAFVEPHSINNQYALPNKIFEYAACGVPTIASNLPNLCFFVNKYNLGKAVNVFNTSGVFEAVANLINTQNNFSKLKALSLNHFSWQAQENKFLALFH